MATTYSVVGYTKKPAIASPLQHPIMVPFVFYTGGVSTPTGTEGGSATITNLATPGAFVINDVVRLAKIPKGATICEIFLAVPDLDSGTSLTLEVGLATAGVSVFATGSTSGQAGLTGLVGAFNGAVQSALPYTELSADDVLQLKASAASTGAGTATAATAIKGFVTYVMLPSTVY